MADTMQTGAAVIPTAETSAGANPAAKPAVKSVATTLTVDSIKNSPKPEGGQWRMCYVRNGIFVTAPCTETVFRTISGHNLDLNKRDKFVLTMQDGLVTHIALQQSASTMPGFERADAAVDAEFPGALILSRGPDGSLRLERRPDRMRDEQLDRIMQLAADTTSVAPGARLGGEFTILQIRQLPGHDMIYIDPMSRSAAL